MGNSIGVCPPGLTPLEQDLVFTPLMASISQNHRIITWFGLEGIIQIQPPATGRDSSHSIRLLKALSSLAWNTSRERHPQLLWATSASVSPPSP